MANSSLVMLGQVVYVENTNNIQYRDDASALRIKVRLDSDRNTKTDEMLPYAFPLLPKTMQSVPKVGEGVFVFTAKINENDSQRYYIGPIISQPQFMEECRYMQGFGDAVSLIKEAKPGKNLPLTSIGRAKSLTKGAYPEPNDVAIVGRGQEDVVLKYRNSKDIGYASEIDIRAGIRVQPTDNSIKYLKGNVVFNTDSPSYIQVKYKANGMCGIKNGEGDNVPDKYESRDARQGKSVVNIVADKINLISHKDSAQFGDLITNRDTLVLEEEMDNIMSQMHRAVYGDELITLLKLMIEVIRTHTHPYSMMPPTQDGTPMVDLVGYQMEKLISPNVRIS